MTVGEYKSLCLEYLGGNNWLDTEDGSRESFQLCRENYLSGGWGEQDLDTLATLHVLFGDQRCVANSKEARDAVFDVWFDLPVRTELKQEVIRKAVIENALSILERVKEAELSETELSSYRKALEKARQRAIAASLCIIEGMPEYDAWMRREGIEP
jgi:hypothetical protein